MSGDEPTHGGDVFSRFWSEVTSRMGMPGYPTPVAPEEATRQMQRMFLDALAKYCDEFMRSPQFLDMLKQTLDNALNLRQQVNRFLEQAQSELGAPSKTDVTDLAAALAGMEQRVVSRVEALERKLSTLAAKPSSRPTPTPGPQKAATPKGKAKPAAKMPKPRARKPAKKKAKKRGAR